MRSNRLIGIILITCVILLIAIYVFREGFGNSDNSDASVLAAVYESQKNANAQKQDEFVKSRLQNYNPIGMALTSAGTQGNLGNSTSPLMGTTGNRRGLGGNERVNNLPLSTGKTGMFDLVGKCEAVNTADCSAFDNPDFATNCGICLDLGPSEAQATNSNNVPSIGGRYLSSDDREKAENGVTGDFLPDYTPTFGTCPAPKRMAGTKAQCLRIKRQMECEKAANYDKPNCVQCFGDGNYSIVDPALSPRIFTGSGTLVIFGEGIMNFNEIGYQKKDRIILSKTNGVRITLQGPEMTRITISVTPVDDSSPEPSIGGYITGVTTSGEFVVDMKRILLDDAATGRKPLTGGSMNVDGIYVAKIVTGFAQTQIALNAQVPFTFVDPLTQEGAKCSSSPYVTTQAGAEFLESNPCYKKGSGPGKYSLECLQNIFISNGGLQSGKGYPKDETLASSLLYDKSGKARSLNDITTYIYGLSIISATGVDMYGNKQTIENWSAASVFCTGKEVSTPCDTGGKDTGPLNDECLTYLWDNMGSSNSLGGTYSGISMAKSMFNSGNNARFCQRSGTLSPVDANGKKNRKAIEYWRQQGGVSKVKEIMKTIHEMANLDYNEISDNDRSIYIRQCYGDIQLGPRPGPVKSTDPNICQYPKGIDMRGLCLNGKFDRSGLVMWLDANDPLGDGRTPAEGTSVGKWVDKSGNNNDGIAVGITPTIVNKGIKINNNPERADASQYYSTPYSSRAPLETIFVVYSTTRSNTQQSLVDSNSGGGRQFQHLATNGPSLALNMIAWLLRSNAPLQSNTKILTSLSYDVSSKIDIYVSRKKISNSRFLPQYKFTSGRTLIGAGVFGGSIVWGFSGTIYEVIIFNRVLDDLDRDLVEEYLTNKWKL